MRTFIDTPNTFILLHSRLNQGCPIHQWSAHARTPERKLPLAALPAASLSLVILKYNYKFVGLACSNKVTSGERQWHNQEIRWRLDHPIWLLDAGWGASFERPLRPTKRNNMGLKKCNFFWFCFVFWCSASIGQPLWKKKKISTQSQHQSGIQFLWYSGCVPIKGLHPLKCVFFVWQRILQKDPALKDASICFNI